MVSLDFLEKLNVFKDLDDDQLVAVQGCCQETECRRGEKVFGMRDESLCLWAVVEGNIDLEQGTADNKSPSQENALSSVSEDMTFGWSSLVPPNRYRLSAYCSSRRCRLIKIDRKCLIQLFDSDTGLGYKVMTGLLSVMGNRFHQLLDEVIKNKGQQIMNRW